MKWLVLALVLTAGLTACAPVQRYHPEPLSPPAIATQLENRSLRDPGLKKFMEQNLGHSLRTWPIEAWNLNDLALAAYYFNPQMQVARAQAHAAQAAIITAGMRPNPTVSLLPGIPSPYLLEFNFNVPIQTAGRRGYMIKQATALSQAASFSLAARAWQVRSGVRAALVSYFYDQENAELAHANERLWNQQVQGLRVRLVAGDTSRPTVGAAETALFNARLAVRAAEGRIPVDRGALAAAIGLPEKAIDGIRLSWSGFNDLPTAASLSHQKIQREAVLNRLDVRQALAEYAAAEAALQLEIARQYPDIQIGPGYNYEESNNFFILGLSAVLPIFNRNQGPIAQAEAARKLAAARFTQVQSNAIAQSEAALARYQASMAEWQDAQNSAQHIRRILEPLSRQSVQVGETDWLSLNGVQLEGVAAAGVALQSLNQAQQALGQLEDAVERPLKPGEFPPPAVDSEALRKELP